MIVPSLSTLFSRSFGRRILFWKFVWNLSPVLYPVDWNEFFDCYVFLEIEWKLLQKTKTFYWWFLAFDIECGLIKWFILFSDNNLLCSRRNLNKIFITLPLLRVNFWRIFKCQLFQNQFNHRNFHNFAEDNQINEK